MATEEDASYSPNFSAADADVELVSSNSVHFLVHCKKLEASSQVFEDIFSTGKPSKGDKRARVELAETADVLESLLPYCYSISVADVQIDEESWGVIKAAEKYQVRRALDAFQAAFALRMIAETKLNPEHDLHANLFAKHCKLSTMERECLKRLMDVAPLFGDVARWAAGALSHIEVNIHPLLVLLYHRRVGAELLRAELGRALVASLEKHGSSAGTQTLIRSWTFWEDSRSRGGVSELEEYAKEVDAAVNFRALGEGSPYRDSWTAVGKQLTRLAESVRGLLQSLMTK